MVSLHSTCTQFTHQSIRNDSDCFNLTSGISSTDMIDKVWFDIEGTKGCEICSVVVVYDKSFIAKYVLYCS